MNNYENENWHHQSPFRRVRFCVPLPRLSNYGRPWYWLKQTIVGRTSLDDSFGEGLQNITGIEQHGQMIGPPLVISGRRNINRSKEGKAFQG